MSFNKRILSAGVPEPFAEQNFKHITYTGNDGTGHAITGVGFKPDLIMIKPRNQDENWNIYDSTRGATKQLLPNLTSAESTQGNTVQSFDADGFTLNGDNNVNKDGINYSAWCWKANGGTTSSNSTGDITTTVQANTAAGFSIVKYTGNGSATQTIGHGLNSAPEWMLVKRLNSNNSWVWKNDVQLGAARGMYLNEAGCEVTDSTFWQSASPTSSVFTVGTNDKTNGSGDSYIAYCWHSVAGFSNSTTGSQYTGTGNSDGPTINLGFEPSIIIIKSKDCGTGQAQNWLIYTQDTNEYLSIDNTNQAASSSGTYKIDFLSNGFKVSGSGSGINSSGRSYNYYCWAKNPDEEAPALANSFNVEIYNGTQSNEQSITGFGFDPNFIWLKNRDASDHWSVFDTIRGPLALLQVNDSGAEQAFGAGAFDFVTDGFSVANTGQANATGDDLVSYAWKADDNEPTINTTGSINSITSVNANAGFSMVSFTGTGSNATVAHGLSSAPDMIIFKNRDASASWLVYHTSVGNEHGLYMETNGAKTDSNAFFQDTSPTSTVFSVGTHADPNGNTNRIMAYCFHAVTGYSKFGSYSGSGSDGNAVTLGFKPDFVLIKRTNDTGGWLLFDSRRSVGGKADDRLEVDATGSETANSNNKWLSLKASTFEANGSDSEVNASGSTYIYAAFAQNVTSNTTLANSFKTLTWTGNGSNNRAVTGVGFRPDLVWIKRRNSSEPHAVYDTVRGANKQLEASDTDAEATNSGNYLGLYNFASDGFTLGNNGGTNGNSNTYVGWCWKAGNTWQSNASGTISCITNVNTANGFSIVKYIGNNVNGATVAHGLGAVPDFILIKPLDLTKAWVAWHSSLSGELGYLNHTDAFSSSRYSWAINSTQPSSSLVTIGGTSNDEHTNGDGHEYIMYCWTEKSGYSKFGSYTGNQTTNPEIDLGFKPDWIMIKKTDETEQWAIYDSERNSTTAGSTWTNWLPANANDSEYTSSGHSLQLDSDGFTVTGTTDLVNGVGHNYIYIAFKHN